MIKLAWEPLTDMYQRFELKYGHTDKEADETYLGLTTSDLRDDPYRRYSSSRFDNIDTEQDRAYLRHFMTSVENLNVVTTAYYNHFRRNWYKLNGTSAGDISEGLAGGPALDRLRGSADCTLVVRVNRREYYSYGVQTEGTTWFGGDGTTHELTVDLRYHEDEEGRFQEDDRFMQATNGAITGVTPGTPGSQAGPLNRGRAHPGSGSSAWRWRSRRARSIAALSMPSCRASHLRSWSKIKPASSPESAFLR